MTDNGNAENQINDLLDEFYRKDGEDPTWIRTAEARAKADQLRGYGPLAVKIIFDSLSADECEEWHAKVFLLETMADLAVPFIAPVFPDANSGWKITYIGILRHDGAAAVPILQSALDDRDAEVRQEACRALGNIGESAVSALETALDNADDSTRSIAATALRNIGEPALGALVVALDNDLIGVRSIAVDGLARIAKRKMPDPEEPPTAADEPVLDALRKAIKNDNLEVRTQAVNQSGPIGRAVLGILVEALQDPDEGIRESVVVWLGRIGQPALDWLKSAASDRHPAVRAAAIQALTQFGEDGLYIFTNAVDDEEEIVRRTLVDAAQQTGPAAANILAFAVEDSSPSISEAAIRQLDTLANQEPDLVSQEFIDTLVVRRTGRSASLFDSVTVALTLNTLIASHPRLRPKILDQLVTAAFSDSDDVRRRAISVAQSLDPREFAALVTTRPGQSSQDVDDVIRILGGQEAVVHFSNGPPSGRTGGAFSNVNWTNVLEEFLGATISAGFLALVVYIYNWFTGNVHPILWLPVGLLGFFLLIVGRYAWGAFRRRLTAIGRWVVKHWWSIIASAAFIILGFAIGYLFSPKQEFPLEVRTTYDFEDRKAPTLIDPWAIFSSNQSHTLIVSDKKDRARSGTRSLMLNLELEPPPDFSGIETSPNLQDITLVSAWVFLPASEQTQTRTLAARLVVSGEDSDAQPIELRGEARILEPGAWNSVTVGIPGKVVSADQSQEWNRTIKELYLVVWSDKYFSGPVYIDDIVLYGDVRPQD